MLTLQLNHISKSYGTKQVLNDINLIIEESETIVLLGPSGCGKTTLLKLINRLIEPDTGEILIDDQNTRSFLAQDLRRNIGYIIQDVGLLPHLTLQKNIELVSRISSNSLSNDRLIELLKLVNLDADLLARKPDELSGGQQQRVGIARALANDPEIILMDEPFSALDNITRNQLQEDFLNLDILQNKTIVLVTHDIQEAFKLGDRIVLLNEGEIQQIGTPLELLNSPSNDFVSSFLEKDRLVLALQSQQHEGTPLIELLKDHSVSNEDKIQLSSEFFRNYRA